MKYRVNKWTKDENSDGNCYVYFVSIGNDAGLYALIDLDEIQINFDISYDGVIGDENFRLWSLEDANNLVAEIKAEHNLYKYKPAKLKKLLQEVAEKVVWRFLAVMRCPHS